MKSESLLISKEIPRRGALFFLLVLIFTIGAMLLADWYFRFARYHFEMQLFHLPTHTDSAVAVARGFTTNQLPNTRGGDLTALIGIPRAAEPYMETREAGVRILDSSGFVNQYYDQEITPDVVVVGDSFMATGRSEDIFAARLANRSGLVVKNRALVGHGPIISASRLIADSRFRDHPPSCLIWGFAEREVVGEPFEALYMLVTQKQFIPVDGIENTGKYVKHLRYGAVHWETLKPVHLKKSLLSTSILAQSSQWIWTRAGYGLFGRIHPDLVPVESVLGEPMLMYRYNIDAIRMTEKDRSLPVVTLTIKALNNFCRKQGTRLIVVLIPEKEQVYRDWMPARFNSPDDPIPASSLWAVEAELKREGVEVVNMLPVFQDATRRGTRVYWRDDTHWNQSGVDLAVEKVSVLLQGNGSKKANKVE